MTKQEVLKPIEEKITQWIDYQRKSPKVSCAGNEKLYDDYRMKNDLDCQLTGDLKADTIFSLWRPLRFTLVRMHGYDGLKALGKVEKKITFLTNLKANLPQYLPASDPLVKDLSQLFVLGMTRANVMILPDRRINSQRGRKPYNDYMPHFLQQSFQGGDFSKYFKGEEDFIKWINAENLEMFFEEEIIAKDQIKDLAGTGVLSDGVPPYNKVISSRQNNPQGQETMGEMVEEYTKILEERNKKVLTIKGGR